jgi:putative transposase
MKAFIDDHRAVYGGEPICKVLPIAPSTYYLHATRRANPELRPARSQSDEALSQQIRQVWDAHFQAYGARKVWWQLQREGLAVARCTAERLMRQMGLKGIVRGKTVKTAISDADAACPWDCVNRQFSAERPNALWVADFT